jgi:serine/threonine protein kinase
MAKLEKFGWDNITIPSKLSDVVNHLPNVNHLKILRPSRRMSGADVYFPYRFFTDGTHKYMPAYIKEEQINDGGYAKIYRVRRAIFKPQPDKEQQLIKEGAFENACIKQIHINLTPEEEAQTPLSKSHTCNDEINAILYEAYIHALLCKTFAEFNVSHAVPDLHEVLALTKSGNETHNPTNIETIWIGMELIHGQTLENFLKHHLKPHNYQHNQKIIIDILVQLAYYLHILQEKLHFNHRDMKINNLFIRYHEPSWSRTLHNVPLFNTWLCNVDLVIIDFGFACISCGSDSPRPRASLLSAGSWFRPEHDCLKYGRDIGQLLYSLQVHFPFNEYFDTIFCNLLKSACTARTKSTYVNILNGINNDGNPFYTNKPTFSDGIYLFLREQGTDIEGCKPSRILLSLKEYINVNINGTNTNSTT